MKIYLVESMSDLVGQNGYGLATLKADADVLVSYADAEGRKTTLLEKTLTDEVVALLVATAES